MQKVILFVFLLLCSCTVWGQNADSLSLEQEKAFQKIVDRDSQIKYQKGNVDVNADVKLTVPIGYKFMPQKDAEFVVYDFWGNPKQDGLLGMIVKDDYSIANPDAWAFIVTYENSGFVKDEDAADLDYDEMMENIKDEEKDSNAEREKEGYEAIHMIGWAAKPYYDQKNNILHWAKSMIFGISTDTTLNYDVRILGRKGVLSLNAVGTIDQLADVQSHIPDIIHIASFKEGSKYTDFDPKIDKVAAYTIGGLVAGKLLAKAGLLALLLKNIKLVLLAIGVMFGGLKNKIVGLFSKKKQRAEPETGDTTEITETTES